jgi:sugar/nucleoside kinase (ribokinase family)
VVGEDFPTETLHDLNSRGVDTSAVEIKPGEKSFFWSGKYHRDLNSRDTLITELNVLEHFNPVLPATHRNPSYVLLGNLSPVVQRNVLEQLGSRPKLVAMDTMNFWMDILMDEVRRTIALVDVLTINDEEARQLSGEYSLVKAARKIQEMGPKYLVIKKGEHGALLFHGQEMFYAPALPLEEVFDPTGAGDTFAGGLMGYVASQDQPTFEHLKRGVIYGSAMASYCVEAFGPNQLFGLTEAQIQARARQFHDLVAV